MKLRAPSSSAPHPRVAHAARALAAAPPLPAVRCPPGRVHMGPERAELGARAIISLLALQGTTQTEEQARRGWRDMSLAEQVQTFAACRVLLGRCACELPSPASSPGSGAAS